jgi:hypothetical protein
MAFDVSALTPKEQVSLIYIGYYDRAPDPAGLNFWVNDLEEFLDGAADGVPGTSLQDIATDFSTQAETRDVYDFFDPGSTVSAGNFLTEVYVNLFGRLPDAGGLAFWTGVLQAGDLPVGEVILEIIGGAQGSDIAVLENKLTVAVDWHDTALDNGVFIPGPADAASAASVLDGVTDDPTTVTAAQAQTAAQFNDAPVAANDVASTDEDTAVTIDVLANDSDGDGDALTVTGLVAAANGTLVNNGDGTVTYTPDADYNGSDSFTYTVEDGNGGSDTATVAVDVASVNDAPVAADDTASTTEDSSVTINVLANDSDVDGDSLTVTGLSAAANGTVVNNGDGTVTYTPNIDFDGTESFNYSISDGNGGIDTGAVEVTVADGVGQFFTLTPNLDTPPAFNGGEGDDTYLANQNTLQDGDFLDAGGVGTGDEDLLKVAIQNATGDFFAAPTLINMETIEVNGPNLEPGQDITLDLSNVQFMEDTVLRSFQTTTDPQAAGPSPLISFLDIQNVNTTDLEIIDSNADHLFTYDPNAFLTTFGGDDDAANIKVQEVDGSTIDLELEDAVPGTPGGDFRSHVDIVNLTSLSRQQVSATTFNFIHDLNVGPVFNELNVDGDADLEIEKFLEEAVNDVDATTLDGDFAIDLQGQGERVDYPDINGPQTEFDIVGSLQVLGAIGDNRIDVSGDTNGIFIFQGGDDLLRVGNSSDTGYVREDVYGDLNVAMEGGNDTAILNITGEQNVLLGEGDDVLTINGNVDDLSTITYNDGQSFVDAGAGDDNVTLNGQTDAYTQDVANLDNDYEVLLGAGNDTLVANQGGEHDVDGGDGEDDITINGNGNQTIDSGADDDIVEINGNGNQTIDSGADDDIVEINGDGTHNILLDGGDDDLSIIGSRLTGNNVDAVGPNVPTNIDAGTGNDTVFVDGDHMLNVLLGDGTDSIELNADELTVDDVIDGGNADGAQIEDSLILNNNNGNVQDGLVGRSETSNVTGIEVFDLRDANITLLLSSDNFDSSVDGGITVDTTQANRILLPQVSNSGPQLFQGMTRDAYEDAAEFYFDPNGNQTVAESVQELNDFLINNGVSSVNFFDGNASGDSQTVDTLGDVYGGSTGSAGDTVDFRGAPLGEMVVDITDIPMSVASGRSFELEGGNIKDVIIADDASISSRLFLNYDASTDTLQSDEDTLQVMDGAQISAADLRNVEGLEVLELLSAENAAQTWVVELTDRVINQTTSNADFIIRVDPDVPAGSEVFIDLDPSIWGSTATKNVIIETVSNAQIYVDLNDGSGPQLVTQPQYGTDLISGLGALGTITVQPRLLFTENTDNLEGTNGDDTFTLDSIDDVQISDSANGFGGQDTLLADNVTVANQSQDLEDQLGNPALTSIEKVEFDTGLNVLMTHLDDGNGALQNQLNTLVTGSGNDVLLEMEAIGNNRSEGYFLGGGNDTFTSFDDTPFIIGNGTTDEDYYVDGGLGDDEVTMAEEDNLFGTDIETINLLTDADADLWTEQGVDGDTMVVNGTADNTDNNVDLNSEIRKASDGSLATVILNDIEDLDDFGGDNIIVMDSDRAGPDGDSDVELNDGDDSLTVTNVDDLVVDADAGTKTVNVGGGSLSNVNNFDYTGGTGIDGGIDNIVAVIDDDADIFTGDLDDTVDVTSTEGGIVAIDGGDGNDTITARSVGGTLDLVGGEGNDTFNVTTLNGETSDIEGGLGLDIVSLNVATNGGEDTIVFGDIVYDALQEVDTGATTQNFTQSGVDDPSYIGTANDGIDTITGFNMEGNGAGLEDVLDVDAFLQQFGGDDDAGVTAADFGYGDWTGGAFTAVGSGGGSREIAVIAVDDGFELDGSHISVNGSGLPGIRIADDDGRVVVAARDTDGDNAFDTADLYFVQDVDQDAGQAWAVDKVATIEFATEIGTFTSIDEDNFTFA